MAKTTVEHIKDFRNGLSLFIILIIAEQYLLVCHLDRISLTARLFIS